jgi:hypothetical protein
VSDEGSLEDRIRFRVALERILQSHNKKRKADEKLKKIGFTEKEKVAWTRNEPDFTPRKPPDKLPVYLGR